jgi:DNA helicase-2/ATP-dependent DNA helicase PcrA
MDKRKHDDEIIPGMNSASREAELLLGGLDIFLQSIHPVQGKADDLDFDVETDYIYEEPEANESILKKWEELNTISKQLDQRLLEAGDSLQPTHTTRIDYEANLNPSQLAAVQYTDNPLLVIAGAGSGKTRVITYKVAWLLEKGIPADHILLLTFTKKAAKEMLDRVSSLLATRSGNQVRGGTFHAFANTTLRKYHNFLGIPPNFTILDPEDVSDVIDLLKTELKITGKKGSYPFPKKKKIQDLFSRAFNQQRALADLVEKEYEECAPYLTELEALHIALGRYKKAANVMDYDDLLKYLRDGLKNNAPFRKAVQKNIDYILVDEYQDTNGVQRDIVELLSLGNKHITVVGDDAQSIYAFRGANYENILRFPQSFQDCRVVKIEQNYRSDQAILDFTNTLIEKSRIGFKKALKSDHLQGEKPIIRRFANEMEEAIFIVDQISLNAEKNLEFKNTAVLCRSLWHSNFVQIELSRRNIPFVVVGGIKFSERRHVKDAVAFFKLVVNLTDAVAWHRVLQLLDGIGVARSREIISHVLTKGDIPDFDGFKKRKFYPLLSEFSKLLETCRLAGTSPSEICHRFLIFYRPILQQLEDDFAKRALDLDVFQTIVDSYQSLDQFLHDFTLDPPSSQYQDNLLLPANSDKDAVVISTIHSAKGLEWHTVFIPFALDGLFPDNRALHSLEDMEEERRLFYVGASRAMKQLYITMPAYVSTWDKTFTLKSRYLAEIDPEYFVSENL